MADLINQNQGEQPIGLTPEQKQFIETPMLSNIPQPKEPVSHGEGIKATFLYNNPIANTIFSNSLPYSDAVDPTFNAADEITGTQWEFDKPVLDEALKTNNRTQYNAVIAKAERARGLQSIMSRADMIDQFVGGAAAGILDPTAFIPVFGVYKASKIGTTIATIGTAAATGGAAVGIQEAQLQTTQPTRTAEESRNAILAGAAITGILGGIPIAIRSARYQGAVEYLQSVMNNDIKQIEGSIGAAKFTPVSPEDTKLSTFAIAKPLEKKYPALAQSVSEGIAKYGQVPGLRSPMSLWQTSDFNTVRTTALGTFDHIFTVKGMENGIAFRPMEREMFYHEANIRKMEQESIDGYYKYQKRVKSENNAPMNMAQFQSELTKAAGNGGEHGIPEIRAAYNAIKKQLDEANRLMHDYGIIDDDAYKLIQEGDTTRAWERSRVLADRQRLREIIADGHVTQRRLARSELIKKINETAGEKGKASLREELGKLPDLERSEALSLADDNIDSILGIGDSTTELANFYKVSETTGVGFTKSRTVPVRNKDVSDFLVQNFTDVSSLYLRQAYRMVEFKKALQRMGWEDVNDPLKALQTEYNEARIGLKQSIKNEQKLNKALANLTSKYAQAQGDLKDMINVALGQYHVRTKADAAMKMLRTYNFARNMDQVVLASMADVATDVFTHGMNKTVGGWQRTIARRIYPALKEMDTKDLQALGHINDTEINTVLTSMLDPEFDRGLQDNISKWVDKGGDFFSKVYLMKDSNRINREMGRGTGMHRVMGEIRTWKQLSTYKTLTAKDEKALKTAELYLNEHGLNGKDRELIYRNWEKATGGEDAYIEGMGEKVQVLKADQWDPNAVQALQQAVERDTRFSVLTPGRGDLPLIMQKYSLAGVLLQYKGFAITANNRILLAGLQKGDARVLMGLTMITFLGAMSYVIRQEIAHRLLGKDEPNMEAKNLVREGLFRGGSLGLIGDTVQLFAPGQYSTRLQNTNRVEYWLGPSYGAAKVLSDIWGDAITGDIDQDTADKALRLMPASRLLQIMKHYNEVK